MSFVTDAFNSLGQSLSNLSSSISDTFQQVEKIGQNILDNPLPTIETVALTYVGVPYPVAAAAVSAANGGSLEQIAISAGTAYLGAQAGQVIGNYAGQAVANLAPEGGTIAGYSLTPYDVADISSSISTIVTSASGPAATVAMRGGNFNDVIKAGFSGGVAGLVSNQLSNYNIPSGSITNKLITNSVNSATNAILNGQSVAGAVINATVGTLGSAGLTSLAAQVKEEYSSLSSQSDTLQSINNSFNSLKQTASDYYNNNIQPLADQANGYLSQLNPLSESIKSSVEQSKTLTDQFNNASNLVNQLNDANGRAEWLAENNYSQSRYGDIFDLNQPSGNRNGYLQVGTADGFINDYKNQALSYASQLNDLNGSINSQYGQYQGILSQYNDANAALAANNNTYQGYVGQLNDLSGQAETLSDQITTTATNLGTDTANLAVQTSGVITNQLLDQSAQSAGYSDFAELQKAVNQGFDSTNAQTFKDASALGITNAKDWAALSPVLQDKAAGMSQLGSNPQQIYDSMLKAYPDVNQQDILAALNDYSPGFTPSTVALGNTSDLAPNTPVTLADGTTGYVGNNGTIVSSLSNPNVVNASDTVTPTPTGTVTLGDVKSIPNGATVDPTNSNIYHGADGTTYTINSDNTITETPPTPTPTDTSGTTPVDTNANENTLSILGITASSSSPTGYVDKNNNPVNGDGSPYASGTGTPVTAPVTTPVTAPVTTPVTAPVTTPVTAPVTTPVTAPVTTPVTAPVTKPVTTPVTTSTSKTTSNGGLTMADIPVSTLSKGDQISSPLASNYNIPVMTYNAPQVDPQSLQEIENAATGGIIHRATGGSTKSPLETGTLEMKPQLMHGNQIQHTNLFGTQGIPLYSLPSRADGGSLSMEDRTLPEGHNPQFFSEGGLNAIDHRYVTGDGDGTSDSIPAMLANGEFVIPADVVSSLGNGSNDSGAKVLDELLSVIREHKQKHDAKHLPPDSKGALAYLLQANKQARA